MKFSEIQQTLKSPKDSRNEFGKYNYRTCSAILEAVKPLLGPATLIVSDELVLIGERYYIKATATYTNKDEGETFAATAYAREPLDKKGMDEAQITGASSTYARKAALSGLFAIDDSSNDPDATNTHGQTPNKPSAGRNRGQAANQPGHSQKARRDPSKRLWRRCRPQGRPTAGQSRPAGIHQRHRCVCRRRGRRPPDGEGRHMAHGRGLQDYHRHHRLLAKPRKVRTLGTVLEPKSAKSGKARQIRQMPILPKPSPLFLLSPPFLPPLSFPLILPLSITPYNPPIIIHYPHT